MKILVAGGSGLVGSALCAALIEEGHQVFTLTRSVKPGQQNALAWDPKSGRLDPKKLEGFDAIVNLAGDNISAGRWTTAKKKAILESRTAATSLLCTALSKLSEPPKVLVNISAVGYYGSRGDELLDETKGSGAGFLAQVCRSWESAAQTVKNFGIRLVILRLGVVFTPKGGALKKMLLPFRFGLGGRLGSGEQYVSWIALEDLVRVIQFCLNDSSIEGPVNAVAPEPVTNADLTKILGAALGRPTFMTMPAPVVRLVFGEMGNELLLSSQRVKPKKLQDSGFIYLYPELKTMIRGI